MKKFIFFAAVVFSFTLHAQSNAIIYQKNGKNIPASVKFEQISNYQNLKYADENGNTQSIVASQIDSVVSNSRKFILKSKSFEDQIYLMKLLVGGYSNLYFFKDKYRKPHYIAEHPSYGMQELVQTSTKANSSGKTYNNQTKKYLGTLSILFGDCKPEKLGHTSLSNKSLSAVFISYNECKKQQSYVADEISENSKLRFALLGGVNFTTIHSAFESIDTFDSQTGPEAGIEIAYVPTALKSKINVLLGINYSKKGGETVYPYQNYDKVVIEYPMIGLDFAVRYHFLPATSKINPFLGMYVNKSFILNSRDERMKKVAENGNSAPYVDLDLQFNSSMNLAFGPQLGIDYLISKNSGLILLAKTYNLDDGHNYFQAKGAAVQIGYFYQL